MDDPSWLRVTIGWLSVCHVHHITSGAEAVPRGEEAAGVMLHVVWRWTMVQGPRGGELPLARLTFSNPVGKCCMQMFVDDRAITCKNKWRIINLFLE